MYYDYRMMEFIIKLRQFQRTKRSVRKTLLQYGDKNFSNYSKPLLQLSEGEITTLIFNWIPKVLQRNEIVRVRMRAEQEVYEITFRGYKSIIQVKQVVKRSTAMEVMYYWRPGENFDYIATLSELCRRRDMADTLATLKKRKYL